MQSKKRWTQFRVIEPLVKTSSERVDLQLVSYKELQDEGGGSSSTCGLRLDKENSYLQLTLVTCR